MIVKQIVYDIENDKCRTKVANTLEEHGLYRIQYSVFIGKLGSTQWATVWQKLQKIIAQYGQPQDKLYSIILSHQNVETMQCIGPTPETDFVLDKVNCLYI
jgi:CRISPR-associated protein Cas2